MAGQPGCILYGNSSGTLVPLKVAADGTVVTSGAGGVGDALTTNPLSQFAATTSAQLAGVISDETGSGSLVFATNAQLVTPTIGAASATSVTINSSVLIGGAAANSIEQRNGTNAQTTRVYETYTDASNYSRLSISAPVGGPITFASEAAGTGTARNFSFNRDTTFLGNIVMGSGFSFLLGRNYLFDIATGTVLLKGASGSALLLQLGDTTSGAPALKRSSTILQGRLADDSAFCQVQGKLTTDANATTGLSAGVLAATTNATITVTDASGQVYRVPCII